MPPATPLARRTFLTFAAVGASTALTACGQSQTSEPLPRSPASPSSPMPKPPPDIGSSEPVPSIDRIPQIWGTHMPGVTTHVDTTHSRRSIALTFDACGGSTGSGYDTELIAVLQEHAVPATLFLNERWIRAHPIETAFLVDDPLFQIENHGTLHRPLSVTGRSAYGITGTRDAAEATLEIESNKDFLRNAFGVESSWFRSGTAHYDDIAVELAHRLAVRIAGFAVNADAGATAEASTVAANILAAEDGAIVLAHMNQPGHGTAAGTRRAVEQLRVENVDFVHLP